jgi:hypothetical protein
MKKDIKDLDQWKGQNPFRVPEGYFEGLSSRIMDQLPEKHAIEPVKVSMLDRLLPWLYLAAIIAGLGFFFNLLTGNKEDSANTKASDSFLVQSGIPEAPFSAIEAEEDADYLEYLETQYVSYILAEEMENYE